MVQQRSIEETYQKKNLHEHILDRPDSYIGSTKLIKEDCYVVDSDNKIIKKQIEYARHKYKTKCNCRKLSILVGPQHYSD